LIINIELGGLQTIDPSSDKRLSMKLSAPRNALIDSSLISRAAPFISNRGCELISSQIQTNAINADTQSKLEVPFANIFSSQPSSNTDGNKTKKSRTCKKPVKYFLAGKHSHRTPLSYCNFQTSLLAQGLERTLDIDKAHYIITGFSADLSDLINDYRFSSKPILVVSEEPLWDLTWSKSVSLSKINQELPFNNQCVKYHHLNHFNSDIFDFNLIPYFLLTDSRYISRYILSFQKILKLKSRELLEYWNALPQNTAFIHEKRLDSTHDYIFDEAKPIRLSKYRSELAMNIKTDDILREGKGWPTKLPSSNQSLRQEIPDWHLDKLSKLNKKFRYVSALENVHYSNYVTEKIFDAYASMSVPIYYAREDHYIHKLVKHASFLNLYGLSVDESARAIESYQMTIDLAERYMEDVRYMLKIFTRASNMTTECTRISESLRKVLDNIGN
jgi:hypothetical protein